MLRWHVWYCNFFVSKYFYLKIVSMERYGRVDDVYAVTCPKTPWSQRYSPSKSFFSRARSENVGIREIIGPGRLSV